MDRMCDMCGMRPATTFTSYTINGVTRKQYLCSECAKKYNMTMNFSPDNIIASVFGLPTKMPRTLRVCKVCGATERDILDGYQFGCSECYNTFPDLVDEITARLGQGDHVGKSPLPLENGESIDDKSNANDTEHASDTEDELTRLKRELRCAVDEERFDDASKLKKKIDAIKAKGDK